MITSTMPFIIMEFERRKNMLRKDYIQSFYLMNTKVSVFKKVHVVPHSYKMFWE